MGGQLVMEYRREIDGLRAVAVIPVILFHAEFELFSGGFVGVDIFFVISGYLITTIILTEKERNSFSLINFYERRARRILPALFLVMFVCMPFAWFWLMPSDHKDFSQSLISVSLFSSNILFWLESGYFEAAAEMKPLLHTWSLAVEEQYYVLFPLFLMIVWRYRKRWIFGAIILLGVVSLLLAQWGAYNKPSSTFFLLPTRAWELMIGASAAFYLLYGKSHKEYVANHQFISELFGLLGLALITYSIFIFDETVPFPSFYALVPTLGVVLIILFSSQATIVGRLLANRALVGIGLVSYSAYLWHQPILVFAKHRSLAEPSQWVYLLLIILTFLMAYVSWRFVEKPFRNKDVINRKRVFIFAVVGSVAFITVGLVGHLENGFTDRISNNGVKLGVLNEKLKANYGLGEACDGDFSSTDCMTSDEPEIVVWGDSFAMHLMQGIVASNPSVKIKQMTMSVCGPFFNLAPIEKKSTKSWAVKCIEFTESVRDWLKGASSVKYIVLASPFDQYISESSQLFDGVNIFEPNEDLIFNGLIKTLKELEQLGLQPVIFSPPPHAGHDIGACLVKASYLSNLDECDFKTGEIGRLRVRAYKLLMKVSAKYPVVWLDKFICEGKRCKSHINSTFIYKDYGHLSHEGSREIGEKENFYKLITQPVLKERMALF